MLLIAIYSLDQDVNKFYISANAKDGSIMEISQAYFDVFTSKFSNEDTAIIQIIARSIKKVEIDAYVMDEHFRHRVAFDIQ